MHSALARQATFMCRARALLVLEASSASAILDPAVLTVIHVVNSLVFSLALETTWCWSLGTGVNLQQPSQWYSARGSASNASEVHRRVTHHACQARKALFAVCADRATILMVMVLASSALVEVG